MGDPRILETLGELRAEVKNINTNVQDIKADLKKYSEELTKVKEKVALHASFFGICGSLIAASTSSLFKKFMGS